jgi:hypothetical protein
MQSPSGTTSRISSALSTFESNISKNSGHTSRNFLSNVASSPIRRPFPRRHSLTTAKGIADAYEQIIDEDFKTNPLISAQKFHRRTVGSETRPGLPSLSLLGGNSEHGATNTEHVVSKEEEEEEDSFCELDDDDDDDDDDKEPDVAAGAVVKEDGSSVASGETNVTEAESCESDGETYTRVSLLPSFEEQTRVLRVRDRKPVVKVSPIKLKDRMRAFQQDLTLTAL